MINIDLYKLLPHWFKGRMSKDSSSRNLLDSFEEEILNLKQKIISMYKNTSINTYNNIDYECKKVVRQNFKTIMKNYEQMQIVMTEKEFIKSIEERDSKCFFDAVHGIIYMSECRDSDVITVDNEEVTLIDHRVWNADLIDEFGLLLGLERNKGESNFEYCNRLKSYNMIRGSSSMHGISSYIGHRFSVYKNVEWIDSTHPISISEDKLTVCRHVFVDGEPFECISNNNSLYLEPLPWFVGSKTVTYFVGFDICNLSSVKIDNRIIEYINEKCPVTFGRAKWSETSFIDEESPGEYIKLHSHFDDDLTWIR